MLILLSNDGIPLIIGKWKLFRNSLEMYIEINDLKCAHCETGWLDESVCKIVTSWLYVSKKFKLTFHIPISEKHTTR